MIDAPSKYADDTLRESQFSIGRRSAVALLVANLLLFGMGSLAQAVPLTWTKTIDDPTVTTQDRFGWSVALDGNNVLIGARLDDTIGPNRDNGQAHLFDATTGTEVRTFNNPTPSVIPAPAEIDQFGSSVAIDGNKILVGAAGVRTAAQ